ncbi:MAG: hypothetical protein Q8K98_00405 [Bacteroidota bacterium]|nr:hypothetical protein [Bacteroidota bacterium]
MGKIVILLSVFNGKKYPTLSLSTAVDLLLSPDSFAKSTDQK